MPDVSRCGDSGAPVRLCVADGCDAAGLRRAAAQYGQAGFVRRFTSELEDEDEDEDALQVMQPPTFTRACMFMSHVLCMCRATKEATVGLD